jgi:hypothetical protein
MNILNIITSVLQTFCGLLKIGIKKIPNNRLTAVEIINETVEFYSDTNRRSTDDRGYCFYAGEKGKKCAYSRCWKKGVYRLEYENNPVYNLPDPDELVDERYKCQHISFWAELQSLHDSSKNWNKKGLSEDGRKYVDLLLEKYK